MNDYEKVANWIIEDDNPQEEVAWLLAMLDERGKTKPTFKEAYKFLLRRIEREAGFKLN